MHPLHRLQGAHLERLLHLVKRASCKQEPREFAPLLGSHLAHQIKKAVHSQVSTSCGSRFCRRGGVFIKVGLDLLGQLQPGLVLGVGVGVHQHTCGGVAGVALDGFEVAAGLQELIGRAGMPQPMEYDLLKLRVLGTPFPIPLGKGLGGDWQPIGQPEQLAAVPVSPVGVGFLSLEFFEPGQKFFPQGFRQVKDAVGFPGLGLFQNQGRGAAFPLVREDIIHLAGVGLFQGYLIGALQGLVDRDGPAAIGCTEVDISRLQAEDLTGPQGKDHAQVYRQMQGGVLDGLERRQHGVLVPDGPFFRGDFGRIPRDGRLVNEVPLHCIGKRCFEKRMDFADGSRCQKTLLLCSAQLLLFALNIEPFRGAAQGGIKLFQIVCAYILYGRMPDVRHDQILDHCSGMGVSFRCPFVLAGLDRNPLLVFS